MASQIQELINKIKSEGVESAQQEATQIQDAAKAEAKKIIEKARVEAAQLLAAAKEEIKKNEESTNMALKQSSRDMLLSLRKEIDKTLKKIIKKELEETLSGEKLASILADVMKESMKDEHKSAEMKVALSPADLKSFEDGFIAKLQTELQRTFEIESSEDISKGFTISFDGGKSCFDFTEKSLVDYLSVYLNTQVSAILKGSIETK
ncbi:MAG: hypothetical protein KKD07_07315 [Candidatus Omnitrophica bacterium]|nr:hypothetical protein [Candidatus Omnitrophota bacterium]MBU1997755.1 hypothetical protein [Candidatus Omnitrophota bacterium]MBU4334230.1 hypothetical protein [Candidatus Omnitrophota bacterium]